MMDQVRRWLREADPVGGGSAVASAVGAADDEPGFSRLDILRMRAEVIASARQAAAPGWPRPIAVAATILLMLSAGIVAGRRLDTPASLVLSESRPPETGRPAALDRRQLQFATPGGTRIIWVFDPEFAF